MNSEVQISHEVILGILDHFKRNSVQHLSNLEFVVGAVQGRVLATGVSFDKVFEVPFKEISSDIDEEFLATKLEMERMVNPELDLVGFYITSKAYLG